MDPAVATGGGAPLRVLLVEDHEDTREGYAVYLRMAGASVETAGDGFEGVEKARAFVPDVIVMDLMMPRMDGWRAMRVLRADPRTRFIPAVAVTAHQVDGREDARARFAGFDTFCRKPCRPSELLRAIRDVLDVRLLCPVSG